MDSLLIHGLDSDSWLTSYRWLDSDSILIDYIHREAEDIKLLKKSELSTTIL